MANSKINGTSNQHKKRTSQTIQHQKQGKRETISDDLYKPVSNTSRTGSNSVRTQEIEIPGIKISGNNSYGNKRVTESGRRPENRTRPESGRHPENRRRPENGINRTNKTPRKITQYRKPFNINIGMVIFGIIFIYTVICVIMYFNSKHIIGYEVKTGSLSVSNIYQGIALREEQTVSCNNAGYINYFARESEHVGVGNLVYTVDESGKISDMLEQSDDNALLSDADLLELKNEMTLFKHSFNQRTFEELYNFKFSVKGTALKLSNYNMLNSLDSISSNNTESDLVNFCNAPFSGCIIYSTDGYETLKPTEVTKEVMDTSKYEKNQLISNELVNAGDVAYKLITSEKWSIAIPMEKVRAEELLAQADIKVKFLKNQYISKATGELLENADGTYLVLHFTNSMITFATDRFIDLEIISNEEDGLKIPNSSIVEKTFYLVPKEYIIKGGNSSKDGFMREKYAEDGTVTTEFVEASLYGETETEYYIDASVVKIGEYICKPDSTDKYPISKSGTLIGVYNINKGYADFKGITILYQNDDYAIVESNSAYGLSVYDHIVLEADSVNEDDFIYE